jgi:hypothetical protein
VLYLLLVLAAVPFALAWEEGMRRFAAMQHLRRTCLHSWGPVKQVTIGFKVWCTKCGTQEFCHQDGTLCIAPCDACGRAKRD